jgi:hypothetical protein
MHARGSPSPALAQTIGTNGYQRGAAQPPGAELTIQRDGLGMVGGLPYGGARSVRAGLLISDLQDDTRLGRLSWRGWVMGDFAPGRDTVVSRLIILVSNLYLSA